MTSPSESVISLRTAFSRSSNSPRYFEPATIAPMSSAMSRLLRRLSGTSPSTIRRASPSTIAVLPTPGSPMSTGLFLVRRESTWMTRRISSSRPMTGSSLPLRASSVRSRPKRSSAWYWSSGFSLVTRWLPAHVLERAEQRVVRDARARAAGRRRRRRARSSRAARARWRGSRRRGRRAGRRPPRGPGTRRARAGRSASVCPYTCGSEPIASSTRSRTVFGATPSRSSTGSTTLSGWPSSAASRCSGVTWVWLRSRASDWAAWRASPVLRVNLFGSSAMSSPSCSVDREVDNGVVNFVFPASACSE